MSAFPDDSPTDGPARTPDGRPLLVLASQSPSRVQILRSSGIEFDQLLSGVDEDAALAAAEAGNGAPLDPARTALVLARAKAEAVAALPEARGRLVLGCDSVFELDGRAYGKPRTPETAVERISAMSGRHGVLHTGHWLVDCRDSAVPRAAEPRFPAEGRVRSAVVGFHRMSEQEIRAYVATGEPLWVAGSFTIEGYGAAFVREVLGEPNTVLGLSVGALRELLAARGLGITGLWAPPAPETA